MPYPNLTGDDLAIVEMARDFSRKRLAPYALEWDATKHFPVEEMKEAGSLGMAVSEAVEIAAQDPEAAIVACDPSGDMTRVFHTVLPEVPVWRATAEATGLVDDAVDALTCAQTWHWVDAEAASREADRVVRDGGALPHVTVDELEAHAEGLICLTGGPLGPVGLLVAQGPPGDHGLVEPDAVRLHQTPPGAGRIAQVARQPHLADAGQTLVGRQLQDDRPPAGLGVVTLRKADRCAE